MATKKDVAPAPELKTNEMTTRFAEAIESALKLGEGGQFGLEQKVIDDLLSESVERAQTERTNLIAAAGLALGRASIAAMKKDKNLKATTLDFNYGQDEVGFSFQRTKDNLGNAKIPASTTFGALQPKYVAYGTSGSRGTLKKVKVYLAQLAANDLAD